MLGIRNALLSLLRGVRHYAYGIRYAPRLLGLAILAFLISAAMLTTGLGEKENQILVDKALRAFTGYELNLLLLDQAMPYFRMAMVVLAGLSALATIQQLFFAPKPLTAEGFSSLMRKFQGMELSRPFEILEPPALAARPANVLIARYGIVPFDDRTGFLQQTLTWAKTSRRDLTRDVAVRLVHGPGGCGKTRLALEATKALERDHWSGGVLSLAFRDNAAFAAGLKSLLSPAHAPVFMPDSHRPRGWFLVVDYAEVRPEALNTLMKALSDLSRNPGPPIRVLLLARTDGGWWSDLIQTTDAAWLVDSAPIRLPPWSDDVETRNQFFENCSSAFADRLKIPRPNDPVPDLSSPLFNRPLTLAMMALMQVQAYQPPSQPGQNPETELFEALLAAETDNWRRAAAPTPDSTLHQSRQNAVKHGACQLTLWQGATDAQILDLRRRDPCYSDWTDRDHRATTDALLRLYPAPSGWGETGHRRAGPIEPDLLGEAALARWTQTPHGMAAFVASFRAALEQDEGADIAWRMIAVLIRLLAHPDPKTRDQGKALITALEAQVSDFSPSALFRLDSALPWHTTHLRLFALAVAQRHVEAIPEAGDDQAMAKRGKVLNHLGNRYAALNRHEEALKATEMALVVCSDLATRKPDSMRPGLALCLGNLGIHYSALNRHDEARASIEKAVDIFHDLAEHDPSTFRPDLARSLGNLGNVLSRLGRHEEALVITKKAVAIISDFAEHSSIYFKFILAGTLTNLGIRHSDLNQHEDALEASEKANKLFRDLEERYPDLVRPDLAKSLRNLGNHYAALNRHADALAASKEAVKIYRDLAALNSEAFLSELATSMDDLGIRYVNLNQYEAAFETSMEVVEIYRYLTNQNIEKFRFDLSRSLFIFGFNNAALNRNEGARAAWTESAQLIRPLIDKHPLFDHNHYDNLISSIRITCTALGLSDAETEAWLRQHDLP